MLYTLVLLDFVNTPFRYQWINKWINKWINNWINELFEWLAVQQWCSNVAIHHIILSLYMYILYHQWSLCNCRLWPDLSEWRNTQWNNLYMWLCRWIQWGYLWKWVSILLAWDLKICYSRSVCSWHSVPSRSRENKYFELKHSWGCHPNLNYLLSSVESEHGNLSEQCKQRCSYRKHEHTQFHSHMGTQTRAVGSSRASRALALPLLGLARHKNYYKLFTEQGMQ